jgi:hypothetical protein
VTLEPNLEGQIDTWRAYLRRHQAIHSPDVEELEDHLRAQVATLSAAGLDADEAFLVAVKRLGSLDALSREFAREHSERLWKQLVAPDEAADPRRRREPLLVVALGALAALALKLPELLGVHLLGGDPAAEAFYARNLSLFVLPFLAAYLVWKRRAGRAGLWPIALSFGAAVLFANLYPLGADADTLTLAAIHLPIALWMAVGLAYAGGRWRERSRRMDFVRFSGELFIYYSLIALGGGVLAAFTGLMFHAIGLDAGPFLQGWLLPCGALGAVLVGAWLVEAKQSVIENMAPVLTRLFTPLFAALLVAFLAALAITGQGINVEREMLILFDALLIVVLALLLYTISARDAATPPGLFDVVQLVLVVSALVANGFALTAMLSRIAEMGFTPNRTAALGMNVILIVNLAWSAVLSLRFLRGRGSIAALERWQTAYLPVYAAWAALVVVVLPWVWGMR